jgi:Zn-dependent protease
MLGEDWFFTRLPLIVPLVLSLAVHEWSHAWTAHQLGDDTAERLGRLTLNPLAHLDPIGTVLLPVLGIPFGWAKPVPINPARFAPTVSLRAGIVLATAAGPLSNLCLALLGLFAMATLSALEPALAANGAPARMLLE